MRYSSLAGGKRLRPQLVYAVGELGASTDEALDACACAVELIHTYSLIHDDLPAMDDDDLRRGRPSCHMAYDEATAILAGDALQALAFECLAKESQISCETRIQLISVLTEASGSRGMVGGQSLDLASEGQDTDLESLKNIHAKKTGALIEASVRMGLLTSGITDPEKSRALADYGREIGLAFQVQDDILDIEGDPALMGKAAGADAKRGLVTFPQLLGLEAAKQLASQLSQNAIVSLDCFDQRAEPLRAIARFIAHRKQ
ncbi:MAG TPA: geranyl transferase [Gammaproteobacteria bacterium]|nr:geranyl transferase [Gammaproteobacteria bacterium]